VQTAVDASTGLIVAHEVTTEATDNRSLLPMACKQIHRRDRLVFYAAEASVCGACHVKSACPQAGHRTVSRHWEEQALRRMHERATNEAMWLGRCTVERPFGELKERLLGRGFLLKGLEGTRCEMALAVVAFNLKRLASLLGATRLIARWQPS